MYPVITQLAEYTSDVHAYTTVYPVLQHAYFTSNIILENHFMSVYVDQPF